MWGVDPSVGPQEQQSRLRSCTRRCGTFRGMANMESLSAKNSESGCACNECNRKERFAKSSFMKAEHKHEGDDATPVLHTKVI